MGIMPVIISTVLVLGAVQEQNSDEIAADSTSSEKKMSVVVVDENYPNPF